MYQAYTDDTVSERDLMAACRAAASRILMLVSLL
jgi:hypothetical protein